jgi:hypothetical protein
MPLTPIVTVSPEKRWDMAWNGATKVLGGMSMFTYGQLQSPMWGGSTFTTVLAGDPVGLSEDSIGSYTNDIVRRSAAEIHVIDLGAPGNQLLFIFDLGVSSSFVWSYYTDPKLRPPAPVAQFFVNSTLVRTETIDSDPSSVALLVDYRPPEGRLTIWVRLAADPIDAMQVGIAIRTVECYVL